LKQQGGQQMKNVEMKLDGNILTIKVDVTKEFGPSASGKTIIIASTEGNISIPERDEIKIGLNVYKKKPVAV
jgi:ABC-type molybdate transport system ATPase subunit